MAPEVHGLEALKLCALFAIFFCFCFGSSLLLSFVLVFVFQFLSVCPSSY